MHHMTSSKEVMEEMIDEIVAEITELGQPSNEHIMQYPNQLI